MTAHSRAPAPPRVLGLLAGLSLVLAACAGETASPSGSAPIGSLLPSTAASPTATPEPTPSPTATPEPTPNQADIPLFQAGAELRAVTTLRLRDLPGTRWGVAANLPAGALVQAVVGPIRTDGYGWYLVRDVDPAAPTFTEAWVAAGFAPDAFLEPTGGTPSPGPASPTFVAGFAQATNGDFGPFTVEGSTALRWAVAVPTGADPGASCTFTGSLSPQGGTAVTFLKTTVSQAPAPGTTQPTFFAQHPTLTGDLFLHVDSNCSWAVTVVRLPL